MLNVITITMFGYKATECGTRKYESTPNIKQVQEPKPWKKKSMKRKNNVSLSYMLKTKATICMYIVDAPTI